MLPVTGPAEAGENCTEKVKLRAGATVAGRVSPLIPKPAPVTVARFNTRLALPELVSVTLCVALCPVVTFPKVRDEDEREKPVCTPTPLSGTESGVVDALLLMARLPEAVPAEAGENVIVRVAELAALTVAGKVIPLREKAEPVRAIEETVRSALPVLLRVTATVPLLPTVTLPKLTLVLLTASCGVGVTAG